MKIKDFAKEFTDKYSKTHKISEGVVEGWLIRLDTFIRNILKFNCIDKITRDSELIMGRDFQKAYVYWCLSKVYYKEEHIDQYDYYSGLFRSAFEDYQRELKRFEYTKYFVKASPKVVDQYELMLGIGEDAE